MKKITTLLALAVCLNGWAQIPNSGFETWVTNTETPQHYLVPQNWVTIDMVYNSFNSSYTVSSVVRTTQSHSGAYAVLMQTAIGGGDTVGGSLYSCNSLANFGFPSGYYGFPYTARPAFFQGYYKFTSVGGDVAVAFATLTKWNTATHKRDTVAECYFEATVNATSYTQFSIPLTYILNEYPDTAYIQTGVFLYGGGSTHIGTQFYLDDLGFSGSVPLGIEQYAGSNAVSIYPNPNNGSFVIEPNNATKQTMQVYDVNGKMVLSQILNSKTTIDANSLNEGVYNISISSNEGIQNKRLVIVR
ncbi:MAG: T9SS type A sorting domain-containing protein [Bacteroidia bacterium]